MNSSGTDKGVINEGKLFNNFKQLQIFSQHTLEVIAAALSRAQMHSHTVTQTATRSVETGLKVSFAAIKKRNTG